MNFGRKDGPAPYIEAPRPFSYSPDGAPAQAPFDLEEESAERSRLMLTAILSIWALAIIESMWAGAELITPINQNFLYVMYGLGLAVGIATAFMLLPSSQISFWKSVLMVVAVPLFGIALFHNYAWRIENYRQFAFSSAPYETAYYPIKGVDFGRKGRRNELTIDPYKVGDVDIGISKQQYEMLWPAYVKSRSNLCVAVLQRRSSSGAIQILNDGVFTVIEPASREIRDCPPEAAKFQH